MGKLSEKSEKFINSLRRKKNIRKLTKKQYDWLSQIVLMKSKQGSTNLEDYFGHYGKTN